MLFSPPLTSLADIKLFVVRFVGPIITQVSGAAGGIFAPSLAAGGSIGSILSYFAGSEYHNLFIILGMIAFLTGVTRAPFTSFVLVLEMTDRHSVLFLMMIAALIANVCSRIIDTESFYERVRDDFLAVIKK
jgi:H+/Cl- antiporter ClcA